MALSEVPQRAPSEVLKDRLDDPVVADSLNTILDRADVLAFLVGSLDGAMRRGEVMLDGTAELLDEARNTVSASTGGEGADIGEVLAALATLAAHLPRTTRAIDRVVESGALEELTSPAVVDILKLTSQSLNAASDEFRTRPVEIKGPVSVVKLMRDDDINRGLSFVATVLRSLGRGLRDQPITTTK